MEEGETTTRNSEFQFVNRHQKRALHEHHLQRKRCRIHSREDTINVFRQLFEDCAWERLMELTNVVFPITEVIERNVHSAILSMDKNKPVKLWPKKCMTMSLHGISRCRTPNRAANLALCYAEPPRSPGGPPGLPLRQPRGRPVLISYLKNQTYKFLEKSGD